MTAHPNAMQLDLYVLGQQSELSAHIEQCERCAAFVVQSQRPPTPMPQMHAARGWWLGAGFALAGACAAALVFLQTPDTSEKGAGGIAVYVKHGDTVTLWDGKQPLEAGDAVRLELPHTRHTRVSVRGATGLLYEGALPPWRLPVSFRVDGTDGDERLSVLLSDGAPSSVYELVFPKAKR